MWRLRVVHSTGYAYKSPATSSFNEARLTPRSDNRQNVILSRVETVPATRSYRYIDYWGTAVTAFDLHAPHTELEVTASSVVETDKPEPPSEKVTWDELNSEAVIDRFDEVLTPTHYTPHSRRLGRVGERIVRDYDPYDAVIAASGWVQSELDYVAGTTGVHSQPRRAARRQRRLPGLRAPDTAVVAQHRNSVTVRVGLPTSAAQGDRRRDGRRAEPRLDSGMDRRLVELRPDERQRDQRAVRQCRPRTGLRRRQPP